MVIILILLARNIPVTAPDRLTNIPMEEMVAIFKCMNVNVLVDVKSAEANRN